MEPGCLYAARRSRQSRRTSSSASVAPGDTCTTSATSYSLAKPGTACNFRARDAGIFLQHTEKFAWVDVEAVASEHRLAEAMEANRAIRLPAHQVPGPQVITPKVARAAPVLADAPTEQDGSGKAQFAHIAIRHGIAHLIPDGNIDPRQRKSHGPGAVGAIHPVEEADRCCLRDPVSLP